MSGILERAQEDKFFIHSLQLTAAAPTRGMIQIDGDAFYEIFAIMAIDDAQTANAPRSGYMVDITELSANGGKWWNTPVMSNMAFGLAANPRYLRTPIIVAPNTSLLVEITAAAVSTPSYNRFDVALWGTKRYQMSAEEFAARRQRPYFLYTHVPQTITSPTGFTQDIQIATDGDFVVQQITSSGVFNQTTAGTSGSLNTSDINGVYARFRDLSSNKEFMQNPIPWMHLTGQPDFWMGPNRLLSPLVFRRNSLIQLSVTVDTNDVANVGTYQSMQIGFEGYKIKD